MLSSARLREPSLVERFEYYQRLLRARLPVEARQVKPDRLLTHVPPGWKPVLLDERGKEMTSEAFARWIDGEQRLGTPGLAFLIGEADGLPADVKAKVPDAVCLSRLTLPHQLCFVLLAEQLYRASAILRGEPYHRA